MEGIKENGEIRRSLAEKDPGVYENHKRETLF